MNRSLSLSDDHSFGLNSVATAPVPLLSGAEQGDAKVLLDLNADGSVAKTYLNGPGLDNHLRQTSSTAGVSYYLTDHLGSTAGLTDTGGNVVEQQAYDSFANNTGFAEGGPHSFMR